MKIALYLGSFNPFHNGHLEVIKIALNKFKMDKVIIVPTMQNRLNEEKLIDFDHRYNIILNSLYYKFKYGTVVVSEIEKKLIPPYYSYATFHALKNKYCNDEIFVLVGNDTMKDIPNWMHGEAIIQDYDFLIVDRPKNSISSSMIRNRIKCNRRIDDFVSPNVINLINKFYRK